VKHTTVTCDRCKSPVAAFSIMEATAGPLRKALPNALDLCEPCGERFKDWLRGGYPDSASHDGPGARG
jgi:hypothetical protein